MSLGGVSISLLPTIPASTPVSFAAEQRTESGTLYVNQSTPSGSILETLILLHPDSNVASISMTWTAKGGDPPTLTLNASVWVSAYSRSGNDPHPYSVGCMDSSGVNATCAAPNVGVYASRRACDPKTSPIPMWAALSLWPSQAKVVGGGVTSSVPNTVWESVLTLELTSGGDPTELILGEGETRVYNDSDPSISATRLAASTSPLAISTASQSFWETFWSASAIDTPTLPYLHDLWYGAQYILAGTSPRAFNVTAAPGLFGVWVSSDSSEWSGDFTLDYNYGEFLVVLFAN